MTGPAVIDPAAPPELWGGIECTVARIGDRYRDQAAETGHRARPDDLDRVAGLGIRTLRYPVLWETVEPDGPRSADWSWHDARLGRLKDLGISPVAGLVHHGSGPVGTDLLDPAFAERLAAYAGRVARRYPWIEAYTPVNEPLTTARFSALYGHWYPHHRDGHAFLRALVNQCRATLLSMRAIRAVTPGARLIQTEDLGRVFSTPELAEQAAYENERRWLGFDLLTGRVDRAHPWWRRLIAAGVEEDDLDLLRGGEGTPDILGINHYLTSERFLDHRTGRYPARFAGGNGRDTYADLEAVRIDLPPGTTGPKARLREAAERYGLPLAVTEVHHGCSREEQLRWLMEVWDAARSLRREGVDLRAVTVWSLFGAVDWNSLLTADTGFYEPGAFDVRSDPPRPTALAAAARSLATAGGFDHPVLDRFGWWHREDRFYHRPVRAAVRPGVKKPRPLLVTGTAPAFDEAFARVCRVRGLDVVLDPDFGDPDGGGIDETLDRHAPWAVIDLGALDPAGDPADAGRLAAALARRGLPMVMVSRASVFAAASADLRGEDDPPAPADAAGRRLVAAEVSIRNSHPAALIVRTGPVFGPWDDDHAPERIVAALEAGEPVMLPETPVTPAFVPDAVHAVLDLLIDGETGIRHLVHGDPVDLRALGLAIADQGGFDRALVLRSSVGRPAEALTTRRGQVLPRLSSALGRWLAERGTVHRGDQLAAE